MDAFIDGYASQIQSDTDSHLEWRLSFNREYANKEYDGRWRVQDKIRVLEAEIARRSHPAQDIADLIWNTRDA